MPFTTLIVFMTNLIRKSLQVEIGSFVRLIGIKSFSKQAFSQARKKLPPIAFKLLNEKLITEFYTDNDFKHFKGFRLLAIDGSTLRLPSEDELYEAFGYKVTKNTKSVPLAKISMLYDVLNHVTINSVLTPYNSSEREMAKEIINELCELKQPTTSDKKQEITDLLIFDRGYPSNIFMHFLLSKKKHFLIRAQSNMYKEIKNAIKLGMDDSIVVIPALNKNQRQTRSEAFNPYKKDFLQIRILIFNLKNNEKEIILTSLLDQEKFTYDDIFKIYNMRWTIEENYKLYKCIANLENFTGRSRLAIEQDVLATIFTCNIASLLAQEAEEEIAQEQLNKANKYQYKINRQLLIGTIKNEIIEILLGNHDLNQYFDNLKTHIKKGMIPIRPGRSYSRRKKFLNVKIMTNKGCL